MHPPYRSVQSLTFVLIHGAWADTSFWDGVSAELRQMRHTVHAPPYAGHDSDPNRQATHDMIVKSVVRYILEQRLSDIVLVGHSFGGTIIQKVAEQLPERIRRLVFLNAFVLPDGQSVAEQLPPAAQAAFAKLRAASPDDTIALPYPLFRESFANLGSKDQVDWLYSLTPPEPAGPLYEKLDLKKFYSLPTPRSYVYLTEDNVFPQTDEYSFHPAMSARLGLYRLIKGSGDHMVTPRYEPGYVARLLYMGARD
ncbi:alpha/beta fold hydrolase [Cohnella fermenti]|uniref:Alpha/beta hydrolase n=1 Tax=Cohnella fermenti TaxID=2565925 RepID=A0A4S4BWG7_9BACL|nr:alpha/beta fold hydrolase [Cohnella fermenti]THF79534.1 alpha/beta hydrolase [Cohnella fermenti]